MSSIMRPYRKSVTVTIFSQGLQKRVTVTVFDCHYFPGMDRRGGQKGTHTFVSPMARARTSRLRRWQFGRWPSLPSFVASDTLCRCYVDQWFLILKCSCQHPPKLSPGFDLGNASEDRTDIRPQLEQDDGQHTKRKSFQKLGKVGHVLHDCYLSPSNPSRLAHMAERKVNAFLTNRTFPKSVFFRFAGMRPACPLRAND